MVKCRRATASDLPLYDIFAPQKVPLLKISDDVIGCDLWFGPPPQSNILATPMKYSISFIELQPKARVPKVFEGRAALRFFSFSGPHNAHKTFG